ncbi:hypothetical protein [Sphingobium sp.]|uniref:hypothetical protein n=1 Tax=Sphingobium sp. TaxID=1912891 RepID=UPI0035C74591
MVRGSGLIARLAADRSGVSAAEYALLLGVLAGSVAIGAWALGQSINGALDDTSAFLASYAGSTASSGGGGTSASSSGSPGNSGSAPGQNGTTPGQSGSTPASGSAPPGQAGATPGQNGNNPGQANKKN